MLATFIIGLREGLEAALIVGIIAAFLRRSGKGLSAMWAGVAAAVVLSLCVGFGLAAVERSLPQAAQEGLETIIGAIAVVFVTGMIFWMNANARDMKRQIEADAAQAVGQTGGLALALMAFLAVLKEGFETSVFLLATFSVAQSAFLAAVGAVAGLILSVLVGWGIYAGGVRLNLSRFFKITGAFLIVVAAGLVVSSLRTAHEAGWLNAGQTLAMDLSWLVAPGTIRSALVTGVLGIPRDPRVVEVVGWVAYLVPVAAIVYWPVSARPGPVAGVRLKFAAAGGLALLAIGLVLTWPQPSTSAGSTLPLVATDETGDAVGVAALVPSGDAGPSALSVRLDRQPDRLLPLALETARPERHAGVAATLFETTERTQPADLPTSLTLDEVVRLAGGRLPRGINPGSQPGPFQAVWAVDQLDRVWIAEPGRLLDATADTTTVVTVSGGGLRTPRTFRAADAQGFPALKGWQVAPPARDAVADDTKRIAFAATEREFWAGHLPIGLLALALLFAATAGRTLTRRSPTPAGLEPATPS